MDHPGWDMHLAGGALLLLLLLAAACDVSPTGFGGAGGPPPPPPPPSTTVSYNLDVQPIFDTECTICHGGAGGLQLESFDSLMVGGNSGPVVAPADPDASLLVRRLDGSRPPTMPLNALPLPGIEIDVIRTWIAEGAQDN